MDAERRNTELYSCHIKAGRKQNNWFLIDLGEVRKEVSGAYCESPSDAEVKSNVEEAVTHLNQRLRLGNEKEQTKDSHDVEKQQNSYTIKNEKEKSICITCF